MELKMQTATLGGGCFWCLEAIFQRLKGVEQVVSGYSGGPGNHPTYEQVCSGSTGHAEVIRVTFDPALISYTELLQVFWSVHDPTTLNRQGADVGTQYRSVIFWHDEDQHRLAYEFKNELNSKKIYPDPVITEISPVENFFPAEKYHQDYYNNNTGQSYCSFVITPKLEKFKKIFADRLKVI